MVINNDVTDDPRFLNPAAGDHHIGADSAALDRGVACGVTRDRDGNPRPVGAYEYQSVERKTYLPVVRREP